MPLYRLKRLSLFRDCTSLALYTVLMVVLTLGVSLGADAEPLSVNALTLKKTDSYTVNRKYGGQLFHKRDSELGFQFGGSVTQLLVDEGDHVERNQLLARLDDRHLPARLEQAKASVKRTVASLDMAKIENKFSNSTWRRHQDLIKKGHTSVQKLDEVSYQLDRSAAALIVAETQLSEALANQRAVEVDLDKTMLRAPYAGIIQSRHVDEGAVVSAGRPILGIVESGVLEARVGIPLSMVEQVRSAKVFSFTIDNNTVVGTLGKFLPRVDETTGTVTALFDLEQEPSQILFAGALTEMEMQVKVAGEGFWVPLSALSESQRGLWNLMVVKNSTVESRLVEVIYSGENSVFVRGTLNEGDQVIRGGVSRLVAGQAVAVIGS